MVIALIVLALLLSAAAVWWLVRPLRAAPPASALQRETHAQLTQVRERLLAQLNELDVEAGDRNIDANVLADERARIEAELAAALKQLDAAGRNGLSLHPPLYQLVMKRNLELFPTDEADDYEPPDCPLCLERTQPERTPLDPYGDHLCSCKKGGGVVTTHNAVRDLTSAALHQAHIPFTKESLVTMAKSYKSSTWRPDISLPNGTPSQPGKELLLDFTITNPLVKTHSNQAAQSPDSATVYGEKVKQQAVGKHIHSTAHFLPVSLSVFGAVGPKSRDFYRWLLTQLSHQSNKPYSEVASAFWIKQSILIQRLKAQTLYNALLALERMRRPSPTDIHSDHPLADLIATSS